MSVQSLTLGRGLLALSQLFYSVGSFVADYNHTHVLNPRWPPHAKFHNGQTMSLSVLLAVTTLYILFRPVAGSLPSSAARESVKHDLLLSSWIGSFYMLAGLSAIWYPGTGWLDPEFRVDENVDEPAQLYVFGGGLALLWAGYAIERTRLGKEGRSTLRSEVKQR